MNMSRLVAGLKGWRLGAVMLLSALFAIAPAHATKLNKQNLTALIGASQSIIAGTVTSVTDGFTDKGTPYTEVTIAVSNAIKGKHKADSEYTFRQFGLLKPRTMANGHKFMAVSPQGFPRWTEGEMVMAFLYKPASKTGFQTTAGLAQGKLTLSNGKAFNEFNNFGLFEDVEIDPNLVTEEEANMLTLQGAVDASTFLNLVKRAVDGNWVEYGGMK
jgi:hypothetical protein